MDDLQRMKSRLLILSKKAREQARYDHLGPNSEHFAVLDYIDEYDMLQEQIARLYPDEVASSD